MPSPELQMDLERQQGLDPTGLAFEALARQMENVRERLAEAEAQAQADPVRSISEPSGMVPSFTPDHTVAIANGRQELEGLGTEFGAIWYGHSNAPDIIAFKAQQQKAWIREQLKSA